MFIVIDTETSGLDRGSRMLSLAAIAFDPETNEVADRREWLINPGMPVPPDVTPINGFTTEKVKDGVPAADALAELFAWMPKRAVFVAHYACYDTGIITWAAGHAGLAIPEGITVIDTCDMAKAIKATKNNKLDTLVAHYGIQRIGDAHRAMSDADACLQYFNIASKATRAVTRPWDDAGHDYRFTAELPDPLSALPELVATGEPLTFVYEDDKGEKTERTLTVYGWAQVRDTVQFHGWCHLRNARRSFRADRVLQVL